MKPFAENKKTKRNNINKGAELEIKYAIIRK
jgi:hypothetical protein